MKYFKLSSVTIILMFGLLSCTNSNDASNTAEKKNTDTAITKTIIVDVRTVKNG
jgi:hypothetical protein